MKHASQKPELITVNYQKPAHNERKDQYFCITFGAKSAAAYQAGLDSIINIKKRFPGVPIVDISAANKRPAAGTLDGWIKSGAAIIRS